MMELGDNNKVSVIIVSAGKSTLENTLFNLRDQFRDKLIQVVLVLDTSHEWNFSKGFLKKLTDRYFQVGRI